MREPGGDLRRQCGLGLFGDRLERRRFVDREIRQHLAVDSDARLGQAVDKHAVGHAERAHRGIEALDPQCAKCPLLALAVAEGVLPGLLHRLLGGADGILAAPAETLGGLVDFLVLGVRGHTAFDASHDWSPSSGKWVTDGRADAARLKQVRERGQAFGRKYFLMLSPSVLNSTRVPRSWRICFLVRLIMPWRLPRWACITLPVAVTLKRFLAPDLVFSLGIWLSCCRNTKTPVKASGRLKCSLER